MRFLEFFARSVPSPLAFSYDWRQDVRDSGRALCVRIARLPARRVTVVAHSMGGLVALACLQQGAPTVRKVIFAGTPFAGSPKIFPDLVRGDHVGRNHALLSSEALFTFASAFQLLPPAPNFLLGEPGDPFSPAFWTGRGIGVFADPPRRTDEAYLAQLRRMLLAHQAWRLSMRAATAPRALVIIGVGHETVSGVRIVNGSFDFNHPPTADGDGTVTADSARPAFAHEELITKATHTALLDDDAVRQAIARQAIAAAQSE